MRYFSVKRTLKIAGKTYRPCVCYQLPDSLLFTAKSLVEQGIAEIHDEEVFFQSGKKIDAARIADKQRAKEEEKIVIEKATRKKSHKELKDELAKIESDLNSVEVAVDGESTGQ